MAKRSIFVALFLMMLDMDPLMNALSNPRLAAIRGPDIGQLLAVAWTSDLPLACWSARAGLGEGKRNPKSDVVNAQ